MKRESTTLGRANTAFIHTEITRKLSILFMSWLSIDPRISESDWRLLRFAPAKSLACIISDQDGEDGCEAAQAVNKGIISAKTTHTSQKDLSQDIEWAEWLSSVSMALEILSTRLTGLRHSAATKPTKPTVASTWYSGLKQPPSANYLSRSRHFHRSRATLNCMARSCALSTVTPVAPLATCPSLG